MTTMTFSRNQIIIVLATLAAVIGVVFAVTGSNGSKVSMAQATSGPGDAKLAELLKPGPLEENAFGNPQAPVTIIEYSSMTCGHCANFHKTVLPKLKEKYVDTGKVRYIIREFPLDDLARGAFMLARCAGPVRYLSFVDTLYAKQEEWAFGNDPLSKLRELSKQAGFTEERFNQCLRDQNLLDGINMVQERGRKFGVRSTPTFFINGQMLRGVNGVEAFEKIIDPLLKG
jgi:protein-disulfide isomerase